MRVLELFAGAGGAALGLHAAGMEAVAHVEWNHEACETMRAAGLVPVVEGDVRDLDAIEETMTGSPASMPGSSGLGRSFMIARMSAMTCCRERMASDSG